MGTSVVERVRVLKENQEKEIQNILAQEQAICPHSEVGHWDGFSEYSTMYPHRVCIACGLEEEGGWWCYSLDCPHWHPRESWDKYGKQIPTLLGPKKGRTFKKMSFDEVMRLRP